MRVKLVLRSPFQGCVNYDFLPGAASRVPACLAPGSYSSTSLKSYACFVLPCPAVRGIRTPVQPTSGLRGRGEERSTGYSNWIRVRGPFEISGVHSRSLVDPLIPFLCPIRTTIFENSCRNIFRENGRDDEAYACHFGRIWSLRWHEHPCS